MSDHDAAPDPIDDAYVRAEALMDDEAARTARRARVLAAVAQVGDAAPAEAPAPRRRTDWRRGGWLAAAGFTGLVIFAVVRVNLAVQRPPQPPPPPIPQAAPPMDELRANTPTPPAPPAVDARPRPTPPPPPVQIHETPLPPVGVTPPPPIAIAPTPPAPPSPPPPMAPVVVGEQPPAAAAAARVGDLIVTAQKREQRLQNVPVAVSTFTASEHSDAAARLRAAATAGQTDTLEGLLGKGAPVDAPDADGYTALMWSVVTDHPAAAALLRRHGASLDLKNKAGQTARDLAKAKDDPALTQALGLAP